MKRAIESVVVGSGATRIACYLRRSRTLVLAYHNVVPHGETAVGDLSLHISQRQFAAHMDVLQRYADVVTLDSALSAPPRGHRPRVAITFDDGYRGAITAGIDELVRRKLPATIFVVPAFACGRTFWWDAVQPNALTLVPDFRNWALDALAGEDGAIRSWATENGVALMRLPEHAAAATEDELAEVSRLPGITLASHTWSHPNLTKLTDTRVNEELAKPVQWLADRYEAVIPWLTYPYGLSSAQVGERAATIYEAALRVDGGWVPARQHQRWNLPRLNVPAALSTNGFAMRLAGFLCG